MNGWYRLSCPLIVLMLVLGGLLTACTPNPAALTLELQGQSFEAQVASPKLGIPQTLAVDSQGNMYVTDFRRDEFGQVLRISSGGQIATIARDRLDIGSIQQIERRPGTDEIYISACPLTPPGDPNRARPDPAGLFSVYKLSADLKLEEVSRDYYVGLPIPALQELGVQGCGSTWTIAEDGAFLFARETIIWRLQHGSMERISPPSLRIEPAWIRADKEGHVVVFMPPRVASIVRVNPTGVETISGAPDYGVIGPDSALYTIEMVLKGGGRPTWANFRTESSMRERLLHVEKGELGPLAFDPYGNLYLIYSDPRSSW